MEMQVRNKMIDYHWLSTYCVLYTPLKKKKCPKQLCKLEVIVTTSQMKKLGTEVKHLMWGFTAEKEKSHDLACKTHSTIPGPASFYF